MSASLSRVLLLFVLSLLLTASLAMADPLALVACVNSGNGNLRLVDASTACHANETRVTWNVAGPAGPAGPAGAAGPAGPPGPAGADAGGPPFVWVCGPVNYGNAERSDATLHILNPGTSTANVAVHFLNKDGVNLAGINVPAASPGPDPQPTYPGQTGSATVAVAPSNTLVIPFKSPFGVAANGGDVAASIRVTSDQPIFVGGSIFFSGLSVLPCSYVHR
jgi:hypothetical protein